ncbi:MAG: hypothetical protein JW957_03325 [Candidatus Omnitrophica bacterium]|nr:hypothetical protein [Candidatus Omnitrophota bacterium]
MITIFATPKKFEGHIKVIQTNAITSWTLLEPKCEVILFGKEPGTAEIAEKLNIRHIQDVKTNEFGTPLVNHLFAYAEKVASFPVLTYVNSDIILCNDFPAAVGRIKMRKFLLVSRRRNIDMESPINFNEKNWTDRLLSQIKLSGTMDSPVAIDIFVFTRGIWENLPPFAVGRAGYDPRLLYLAYTMNIPLVNITPAVKVIHQKHLYSHHPDGKNGIYYGEEARRNNEFIKDSLSLFSIANSSFILTKFGCLLPVFTLGHLQSALRTAPYRIRSGKTSPLLKLLNNARNYSWILKKIEELEIKNY